MKENKNEKVNEYERAPGFRPRLAIYHANAKGTGCAIKMELHPAVGATDGSIFCTFAAQKTVGNRLGPNPTFPTSVGVISADEPASVEACVRFFGKHGSILVITLGIRFT